MYKVRVIPRLDIKGPNLVKGIHLEGLRVLGRPDEFCSYYYENGADEIFYMDCVASLYERNSLLDIVAKTAERVFIPITVGGGLRTVADIRKILAAGADKVSINTGAIKNPSFIREAAQVFGSSTIVVAIEAIRQPDGRYLAFVDNGREETGKDVLEWASEVEELGAGELVITSVDREGTSEGFDVELIKGVTKKVKIPVVAHGGAKSVEDTVQMIQQTGVTGVAVASAFHYGLIRQGLLDRSFMNASEGNTSFLNSGQAYQKVKTFNLKDLKGAMVKAGIPCRP